MSKVKKLKYFLLTLFFLPLNTVYASGLPNYKIPNPSTYDSLEELINAVVGLIRPVFILTMGAFILYGAFTWITSQGNEDKIKSARSMIIAAVTGFAIAVFAAPIINFVADLLGVSGLEFT